MVCVSGCACPKRGRTPGTVGSYCAAAAAELLPAANRAVGMSWRRALARLAERPVDVALTNMDPRLAQSLSGAPELLNRLQPRYFAPMHLGGHVEYIEQYAERLTRDGSVLFRYARPGDVLDIDDAPAA